MTHSTHGIAIQDVADPTQDVNVGSGQLEKSGEKTLQPKDVESKTCYAKAKVEPNLEISSGKPKYNFSTIYFLSFIRVLCRVIGSSFETQIVPSWAGWLSKTASGERNWPVNNTVYGSLQHFCK